MVYACRYLNSRHNTVTSWINLRPGEPPPLLVNPPEIHPRLLRIGERFDDAYYALPPSELGPVNRAIIEQSRKTVVVAHHSKFGKVGKTLIAPVAKVDLIITDNSASRHLSGVSSKVVWGSLSDRF
jgi:DeoR C terminal sensor domain